MESFIELIRQNTNSRTLASPKVSVVNHQEAKIQIGQRLPYSVATTTQTSTIQNVQFLDVGIVLTVTPVITEDGNVLMTVLPKVSGGKITESGFPEEDTTEVQTTVLMPDGGGIVIGGLIREENADSRAIVPGLGRVPLVGSLFRRRSDECRRNELVVALVTHVLPDVYSQRCHELRQLDQTLHNYSKHNVTHPPQVIRGCYHH
jgi:type II secretory pathway component GspD/PulD (secretin)